MRPIRPIRLAVCLVALSTTHAYLDWAFDEALGGWTQKLGLTFSDDCQESTGLMALYAWAESWLSGRRGRQRTANCESRETACPAGLAATGMQVKFGHMRKGGNRELYDFRLRCGRSWQSSWLGLRFDVMRQEDVAAEICADGTDLTGVQVMHGRSSGASSRDYYTFKLRCARQWHERALGLPFDALKETRSATCPHGRSVSGVRVHRGYQDFGSIDTYEFQLQCLEDDDGAGLGKAARGGSASVDGDAGASTLSELLSMGAGEAWELVHSLLAEPPTAGHAAFDASQQRPRSASGREVDGAARHRAERRARFAAAADEL